MNYRQHLLSSPFMPADHLAEGFQDITSFNSQISHMSLESLDSTAGVWGLGHWNVYPSQPALTSVLCCLPTGRSGSRATAVIFRQNVIKVSFSLLTYKSYRNRLCLCQKGNVSISQRSGFSSCLCHSWRSHGTTLWGHCTAMGDINPGVHEWDSCDLIWAALLKRANLFSENDFPSGESVPRSAVAGAVLLILVPAWTCAWWRGLERSPHETFCGSSKFMESHSRKRTDSGPAAV